MICKTCQESYTDNFDEDFIDGVCLPCRAQAEHEEYLALEAKELVKFNNKFNTDYTDDEFFNACDDKDISLEQLKGFPKLRSIWKYMDGIRREIAYYNSLRENKQTELFETDDLPF